MLFLAAAATVLVGACARPPSATVNEGADPFNVDKDVVFRTTYYFRVFDYCVARKLKDRKFEDVVVPLTDSLYRFRMTGKAGSNVSDVKFESGTLMAWEIDPFGAKVEYDPESRRARVISPREVTADARRAAVKRDIHEMVEMYELLRDRLGKNRAGTAPDPSVNGIMNTLADEMQGKVRRFARLDSGPNDGDLELAALSGRPLSDKDRSDLLKAEVRKVLVAVLPQASGEDIDEIVDRGFGGDSAVLDGAHPERPGFVERAAVATIVNADKAFSGEDSQMDAALVLAPYRTNDNAEGMAEIEKAVRSSPETLAQSERYLEWRYSPAGLAESIQCPEDAPVRRGFQVLGPEGWRTFNQDERLMLAMSSSAAPLISTLKDLSNRVISARDNPSAELLPIVLEQKRLSEAGRVLDARSDLDPDDLAERVCKQLVAGSGDEGNTCDE